MNTRCLVLPLLLSLTAYAQDDAPAAVQGGGGGRAMSVLSGRTLKSGTVVHAELGWPSISATLLNALSDQLDVGGKFSLMYGYEGITALGGVPGFKLQGVARLGLLERGKLNLGLRFEPGIFTYFFSGGGAQLGIALPFELNAGFTLSPKLILNFGIDLPMFVVFGPYGGLAVPVLVGGGAEYALSSRLAVTFNLRAGPSVALVGNRYSYAYFDNNYCQDDRGRWFRCGAYYSYAAPALEMMIGVAYRL